VRAQGRRALRRRPDIADGVGAPDPTSGGLGHPAPEVDHGLAVHGQADGCADLAALGEVAFELLAHLREAGLTCAVDQHGFLTSSGRVL
jgi:hypothetical protein